MKNKTISSLWLILLFNYSAFAQSADPKPNFIFIIADDLNDYIGALGGHPQVETPNIDALVNQGTNFTNAYCSAPGCAPSRTSMMSGKDLAYTQVYNNTDYPGQFRLVFNEEKNNSYVVSLPEYLKDKGNYYTFSINKIFHGEASNDFDNSNNTTNCERTQSWNRNSYFEEGEEILATTMSFSDYQKFTWGMIPNELEDSLVDSRTTDTACLFINQVGNGTAETCGNPFFLAIGYHRPHAGRLIPEKYFNEFYRSDINQTLNNLPYNSPVNSFPYNGIVMPPQPAEKFGDYYALPSGGLGRQFAEAGSIEQDLGNYLETVEAVPSNLDGSDDEIVEIYTEAERANYVACYLAAVKYIDAQVGEVLQTLAQYPELEENTIIIFVSDHGYSLGEKKHYTKWALWETDIRVPMIIADMSTKQMKSIKQPVSLLDLYPTICELAQLNTPKFPNGTKYLDGISLMPLINNASIQYDRPVITSYKKFQNTGSCFPHYSLRTENFHYIKYQKNNNGNFSSYYCDSSTNVYEEELYEIGFDREIDPNEWNNLAYKSEYAGLKNYLSEFLPTGDLYLTKTMDVKISDNNMACLLSNNSILILQAQIFDVEGNILLNGALNKYDIVWTNSLSAHTFKGSSYNFKTTWIKNYFNTYNSVIFYVTLVEKTTGKTVGFGMKKFYLNSIAQPEAEFDLTIDLESKTVVVENYLLTGVYSHTLWNFDDSYKPDVLIPGPHTYEMAGEYTITNTIYYGNNCLVEFSKPVDFTAIGLKSREDYKITCYPNPATDIVILSSEESMENDFLEIYNMKGEKIFVQKFSNSEREQSIATNKFVKGSYLIKLLQNNHEIYTQLIEVM